MPTFVLFVLFLYFAMLVGVAWYTGRNNSNEGFFLANRKVPWYVVAYAMIGTSISGVTFISIPGGTGVNMAFSYMQVVMSYLLVYLPYRPIQALASILEQLYLSRQFTLQSLSEVSQQKVLNIQ